MKKVAQLRVKKFLRVAEIGDFILDSGNCMEVHRKQMASSDRYFEVLLSTLRLNAKFYNFLELSIFPWRRCQALHPNECTG